MSKASTFLITLLFSSTVLIQAQTIQTPDQLYGDLFRQVQQKRIFKDGKIFVDAIPRRKPALILSDYLNQKDSAFNLKKFVEANFILPDTVSTVQVSPENDVRAHIKKLWPVLTRKPERNII
jgi:alpha,alpha-trehalase